MNKGEKRTERFTMKITPSLKEEANERAEELGRSLSNYVEQLILKDLTERKKEK